jgi:hypothetical protein
MYTPEEQKAGKAAQLARLKLKGTPQYSEAYAAQPRQIRIKAEQQEARKREREAKIAASSEAAREEQEAAAHFQKFGNLET